MPSTIIPAPAGDTYGGGGYLNDQGQVAAVASEPNGSYDVFVWNQSGTRTIFTGAANGATVLGENISGQVLFSTTDQNYNETLNLWGPNQGITTVSVPAGDYYGGGAAVLNDQGQVASDAVDPAGFPDLFVWNQSGTQTIFSGGTYLGEISGVNPFTGESYTLPEYSSGAVLGENNSGQVLVSTIDSFTDEQGLITTLGLWGSSQGITTVPAPAETAISGEVS